jgi:transposase
LFETLDRPALKPLPIYPYLYVDWKTAQVNIDYHVEVDHHYYSAPYQLVHESLDVRLTETTVEILFKSRRVVSHLRSYQKGKHTTCRQHMPKAHQQYLEWSPSRFIRWAAQIGPQTQNLVTLILENRPHPEQGYRSCLGFLRLGKVYSPERLEAACARALEMKAHSYKNVESILKNELDQQPLTPCQTPLPLFEHANLRGKQYYQ